PALVVGSMSPDFEYFARMRPIRTIGHDLIGIPLLCVPTGLLVLLVFERVMKGPLIGLLPGAIRRRLLLFQSPIHFLPPAPSLLILAPLAVGALPHIAWDAFTHENGWFVPQLPPLAGTLLTFGRRELKVFKFLQYASSAVGLS